MQLNRIEEKFFSDVLRAELNVPIQAILKVYDEELPVMVIPQITQEGYFELRYFGTPVSPPEIDSKGNHQPFSFDALLGIHPTLKRAWHNRDNITLELTERPHPFAGLQKTSGPNICARVLSAGENHKGRLVIHENQVPLDKSTIIQAEFSLVDFPEISHGGMTWMRNRIAKKTNLYSENGWEITLAMDDEQTRGCNSYTGTIRKQNKEGFDIQQLRHVLNGLTRFFSFASCAFRHPTAAIAYGADDRIVWGLVGKFDLAPSFNNWFDHSGSVAENALLEYIFPKFWSKWEEKQDEFTAVINYYVNSRALQQRGFPQNSVATVYVGLELLSHLILTCPHKTNTVSNIEKALQQHNVPHQSLDKSKTPITFEIGQKLDAQGSGVNLLNKVRNYVAHPIDFNNDVIKQDPLQNLDQDYYLYFYIHDLGQFFLEYLLLREMCEYAPQQHRPLLEQLNTSKTF